MKDRQEIIKVLAEKVMGWAWYEEEYITGNAVSHEFCYTGSNGELLAYAKQNNFSHGVFDPFLSADDTLDLIKALNNPTGDGMPMCVAVAQDCGVEYHTPAGVWRAWVRREHDGIEVGQSLEGSFGEAVVMAIYEAVTK